jgi:hypothetical protein
MFVCACCYHFTSHTHTHTHSLTRSLPHTFSPWGRGMTNLFGAEYALDDGVLDEGLHTPERGRGIGGPCPVQSCHRGVPQLAHQQRRRPTPRRGCPSPIQCRCGRPPRVRHLLHQPPPRLTAAYTHTQHPRMHTYTQERDRESPAPTHTHRHPHMQEKGTGLPTIGLGTVRWRQRAYWSRAALGSGAAGEGSRASASRMAATWSAGTAAGARASKHTATA